MENNFVIKNILEQNRLEYDDFLVKQENNYFQQSFIWGQIQKEFNVDVFRYLIKNNKNILAAFSLVKKKLPFNFGCYGFLAEGPIIDDQIKNKEEILNFIFSSLENITVKEKLVFIRFEPRFVFEEKRYNFSIYKTKDITPSETIIMDLNSKDESEILASMSQKTRYNIRLSLKKKLNLIRVGSDNFKKYFKLFSEVMQETAQRDNFCLHSMEYYKKMLKYKKRDKNFDIQLLLAEFQKEIIAGIILVFFGNKVTYLHGASSNKYRNTMPAYFLQWSAIKLALENNCKFYDFYGISSDKWQGVTRFKKSFFDKKKIDESVQNYSGTFDIVFSKKYFLYKLLRNIYFFIKKKMKR